MKYRKIKNHLIDVDSIRDIYLDEDLPRIHISFKVGAKEALSIHFKSQQGAKDAFMLLCQACGTVEWHLGEEEETE